MAHRKDVSTLSNAQLTKLRTLLHQYITKPTNKYPTLEELICPTV